LINDKDSTDPSYSIASILPLNKRSTPEFSESTARISDHRNKSEHSQQKMYPNESKDLSHTNSNQQQKSLSNLSEDKNLKSTINSTDSSKCNPDKLQTQNPSFEILHQYKTREQNDRLNTTSVSDLFKQMTHTKKQKSVDLNSISTVHSIPILKHSSVLLSEVVNDKDSKNHVQSSQKTLIEKRLPISSNIETEQLKNIRNIDTKDKTRPTNLNLPTKRTQSHLTDIQENQPSNTDTSNTFNQVRSMYDDM
jgi:hypothetical protein